LVKVAAAMATRNCEARTLKKNIEITSCQEEEGEEEEATDSGREIAPKSPYQHVFIEKPFCTRHPIISQFHKVP
jgi:hypothetical protein